jgi:hypothetical protein
LSVELAHPTASGGGAVCIWSIVAPLSVGIYAEIKGVRAADTGNRTAE